MMVDISIEMKERAVQDNSFDYYAIVSIIMAGVALESFMNEVFKLHEFYLKREVKQKIYLEYLQLLKKSNDPLTNKIDKFIEIFIEKGTNKYKDDIVYLIKIRNGLVHSGFSESNLEINEEFVIKKDGKVQFPIDRIIFAKNNDLVNIEGFLKKKKIHLPEHINRLDFYEIVGRRPVAIWATKLTQDVIDYISTNMKFKKIGKSFKKKYFLEY